MEMFESISSHILTDPSNSTYHLKIDADALATLSMLHSISYPTWMELTLEPMTTAFYFLMNNFWTFLIQCLHPFKRRFIVEASLRLQPWWHWTRLYGALSWR